VGARPGPLGRSAPLRWYRTRPAAAIYWAAPKAGPCARGAPARGRARLDAAPAPPLEREPAGPASIETFTVLHDREGAPMRGLVVGRLDEGRPFLAATPDDPDGLAGLEARGATGLRRPLGAADATGAFEPRR